jgi:hypothetical protein
MSHIDMRDITKPGAIKDRILIRLILNQVNEELIFNQSLREC